MKRLLSQAKRAAALSLITNFLLAIAKGLGGILGHSDALIADAIESCADIFSSFLVLFGLQYAHKPADEDHPYGHGKAEPLITFAVVGFLLISATIIAVESIRHLNETQQQPEFFTLYILSGSGRLAGVLSLKSRRTGSLFAIPKVPKTCCAPKDLARANFGLKKL